MIKRWDFTAFLFFLPVLLLLIIPFVYSEKVNDFNDYSSLKIALSINNSFYITNSNVMVELLTANLSFFPRTESTQKVESLEIYSTPKSSTYSYDNAVIPFIWINQGSRDYYLGLNSVVSVTNAIVPIDRKIKFPIERIDTQFTKPGEKIDVNDAIKAKAQELASGEDDLFFVSFKIAEWVERNIKYNLSTLTAESVQKSSWVYQNKDGVCDELTNLFISMMRSLGIPARFVSGVAYSNINHKFGAHAWAEVYFPEHGWVPFDITYRQFGWIDPSHVKLKTSLDSGESSIKYFWRGYDVDIRVNKIDVNAELFKTGEKIKSGPVLLSVRPLINNIGPGSYVPLEVVLENTQQFYAPETITVAKAQELEGFNVKNVLLKPNEIKKIYWIMRIPKDLEPLYSYTTLVEIEDQFHGKASVNVTYSYNGDIYSKESAARLTAELEEKKSYSRDLELKCRHPDYAYSYESFFIRCVLRNNGNVLLDNIRICLERECRVTSLGIAEEAYPNFTLKDLNPGRRNIRITADSAGAAAVYMASFNVLENPDLVVEQFNYSKEIDFNDETEFSMILLVKAPVHDVRLFIDGRDIAVIPEINNSKKAVIKLTGKDFVKDNSFNLKITFKDRNERGYTLQKDYKLNVLNVPWYVKLHRWLFRN